MAPTVIVRRVESRLVKRVSDGVIRYGESARHPRAVYDLLRGLLEHEAQEVFCALLLDGNNLSSERRPAFADARDNCPLG